MAVRSANSSFALFVCLVLVQGDNEHPLFDKDSEVVAV